ncbi:MAG: cytochrome c peroxidase [Bacteroidota bacterium]
MITSSGLPRNTPTLINVIYNHLIMLDGKHISLQDQGKDVMHNEQEMNKQPGRPDQKSAEL